MSENGNVIAFPVQSEEWTVHVTNDMYPDGAEIYCGATYLDALQAVINYAKQIGGTIMPGNADVWHLTSDAGVYHNVCVLGWLAFD